MNSKIMIALSSDTSATSPDRRTADMIQKWLSSAGYDASVKQGTACAKEFYFSQQPYIVVTIAEVQPDQFGDAFVKWLNTLPSPQETPRIINLQTQAIIRQRSCSTFYELAQEGYVADAEFTTSTPLFTETDTEQESSKSLFLELVRRVYTSTEKDYIESPELRFE